MAEASEGGSGRIVEGKGGRTLVCDKVFATQYDRYTEFEAALPHRELKFGDRPEVPIIRGKRSIRPRIKEVGPRNTYDNYWRSGKNRDMWKDLRCCVPEARAAFYNNYNRGEDEFRQGGAQPRRRGPDARGRPPAWAGPLPERLGRRALPLGATMTGPLTAGPRLFSIPA